MIKSLIIDDEKKAAEGLKAQLARVAPQVQVVGTAQTVADAYTLILKTQVDLVFLDIMLLDGTGFDLLRRFDQIPFAIIFTTAYDQYAIQAFRFSAVDYLLKPISANELAKAVARVPKDSLQSKQPKIESMLRNFSMEPKDQKLAIHETTGIRYVRVGNILRIEAESNYSRFILDNGGNILSTKSLKNYENLLVQLGFFRCHKSFLINLRQVTRYLRSKKPMLEMANGDMVPVARHAREELLTLLEAFSV